MRAISKTILQCVYNGEIVEMGDVVDVIDNPRHEYTRKLLAAVPSF